MGYLDTANSAVGYWPLQETTGTIATDTTGNGHDGTLANLTFDSNSITGPTNWLPTALEADGTTLQRVEIPDNSDLRGGNQVSLSAWIDISIDETIVPISKGSSVTEKDYSIIKYDSNHGTYPNQSGYYSETGGTDYRVMAVHPTSNQWLHVVVSYDNTTGSTSTYFDGVLVATGSTAGESASTSSPLVLFTLPYETSGRAGAIAGLGMWDRILTPLEVNDLYVGPVPISLNSPAISGMPTIGSTLDLNLATWNHNGYGMVLENSYLEVSDNGVDSWQVIVGTGNVTSFSLSTSLEGKYLRLASVAENDIGISETVYSNTLLISETPWAVFAEQGEIAVTGMAEGEVNLEAWQTAGLIIPGGRE